MGQWSIPASLKNIFRELSTDLKCQEPKKGNLLPWVKEGVFLLNTALSVRDGQALSHMKLWEEFIYSLLIYLNNYNKILVSDLAAYVDRTSVVLLL